MKSTKHISRHYHLVLISCGLLAAVSASAGTGVDTWTGAGGTPNWSLAGNWAAGSSNAPPAAGDTPAFGTVGAGGATLNNDIAGGSYLGLNFNPGAPSFILNGDAITTTGGIFDDSTSLETIDFGMVFSAASHSLYATNGGTLVVSGVISDGGNGYGITAAGEGTVVLTGTNNFSGATTVNAGTLELDFNALGTSSGGTLSNNIINPNSPLSLGGGTLDINGSALLAGGSDTTNSQTFDNTTFAAGNSVITFSGGTNATLALGALTESLGATVVFNGVSNMVDGIVGGTLAPTAGTVTTTTAGGAGGESGGLLSVSTTDSGFATVGAYDWAAVLNGAIVGGSTVPSFYTPFDTTGQTQTALNLDITGNASSHNTASQMSLRFNTAGAITYDLTSIVDGAGLLVTPNVGANNITLIQSSGESFEGDRSGNNRAWVFWQNNTNGLLLCDANITDTKSSTDASVQAGPGTVVYEFLASSVTASYSLSTYLNGGVSEIFGDGALGTPSLASTIYLNGGTVLSGVTLTMDNAGANPRPFAIGSTGGGLAALSNTVFTVDGVISNAVTPAGPLFIGIPASGANGNVLGLVPGTGPNTANAASNAIGIVIVSGTNTYNGGTILYSGTLNFNSNSLGAGGITFNGGALQWAAGTTLDISTQTVTIGPGGGTMNLNGQSVTLANSIGNGGSGSLTVANGTLTLEGAGSYTGGTTVDTGATLIAANASGSATGSGPVTVQSGATLEGPGAIGGALTVLDGGVFTPAVSGVGTATVGSLTLSAGSSFNVQFNGTTNSLIVVANPGGLVINGGVFDFTGLTGPGTYDLIQYSGAIGGSGLDATWTTASDANPHVGNPDEAYLYSFAASGGHLTVTVTPNLSAVIATWTNNVNGAWSTAANWSPNRAPHSPGDVATLGTSTGLRTVTLDVNETVGSLSFTNANSFVIAGGATALTIDNSGSPAGIGVTAGTANAIQTGVSLNSPAQVTVGTGDSLAISGSISNELTPQTVLVNGAGLLALSGNNSYGPAAGAVGTTLTGGGALQAGNNNALGAGDLAVTGNSTLQAGASVTLPNNIDIGGAVNVTVDTQGNSLGLAGTLTDSGNLTKIGSGTLTLGGNSANFTGAATVDAGTLSISTDANLGADAPVVLNGGGLTGNGNIQINRNINIGPATGPVGATAFLDAAGGVFAINGVINSSGNTGADNLTVNGHGGNGTVQLLMPDPFVGTTVVAGGVLDVANAGALEDSTLFYNNQGGVLTFDGSINAATLGGLSGDQSLGLTNAAGSAVTLTVGGNNSTTVYSGNLTDGGVGGALMKTGSGTLTLTGVDSYTGTTTVSGGTLEIPGGGVLNVGTLAGNGYLVDGGLLTNAPTTVNSLGTFANAFLQTAGTVNIGEITQANDDGMLIEVTGGSFTCANMNLLRDNNYAAPTAAAPTAALTTVGFYVDSTNALSPAQVYLGQMTIGATGANSSSSFRMDAGSVTVTNEVLIGSQSATVGRWDIMQVNGGNFTNLDTVNGIVLAQNAVSQNDAELYLSGGNTYAQLINFGTANDTQPGLGDLIISNASLYVGSGGMNSPSQTGTYVSTMWFETGILGALGDWASTITGDGATTGMLLAIAGDSFAIQAADPNNVPHNITLSSLGGPGNLVKTGAGTLALTNLNTWSGSTTVAAGTLALSGDGVFTGLLVNTPSIDIMAPGVVNVAGLPDDTLHVGDSTVGQPSQALSGNGAVNGNVLIASQGVLAPGNSPSNFANFTITGNLTNAGALIFKADHTSAGATNDSVSAQAITNLAGSTLTVTQGAHDLVTGDKFKLLNIAGNNGVSSATNLTLTLPVTGPVSAVTYVWNTNNLAVNGTIVLTTGGNAPLPTTPTNLLFSVSAGALQLSWPSNYEGWSLQSNSVSLSLTNDWFTIAGTSTETNVTIPLPTNGNVFFRMYYTN